LIDRLNKHLRRFKRWYPLALSFELKIEQDSGDRRPDNPNEPQLLASAHPLDSPAYSDELLESTYASAQVLMFCFKRTNEFEDNN
jgi:hypothetical protein